MPLIWTSMAMALVVKAGGLTALHLLPQLIMMKVITMTMMVIHTLHANHPPPIVLTITTTTPSPSSGSYLELSTLPIQ